MTEYAWTIWGQAGGGAAQTNGPFTLATEFTLSQDAALTGIWFNSPAGSTLLPSQCGIFLVSTQALLIANTAPAWSGAAASGWVRCPFDGTFQLFAGTAYKVAIYGAPDFYGNTLSYWTAGGAGANGITTGIIAAPNNAGASPGQGSFSSTSGGLTYPGTTSSSTNFWVDVEVTTGIPAMSPPVPGFTLQSPRTWGAGDQVTTPRLRADMYNLAALTGQGRPVAEAAATQTIPDNTVALLNHNNTPLNSWNTVLTQGAAVAAGPGTANFYPVPLPGWYLLSGAVSQQPVSGGANTTIYAWSIIYNQGTAAFATRTDFSQITGPPGGAFPAGAFAGGSGAELIPLTPVSGDIVGALAFNLNSTGGTVSGQWAAEWVGLPGSASINGVPYTGPLGTVVTNPKPASMWPPGPGGTLSGPVSAGGSILAIGPVPGLRAGGTIGVDWLLGQQYQPYAETVPVQSVAGGTVTLSGTLSYAHAAGAPVAIPVSAAFLNEQIRDQCNFWFYPPMLRAIQGTASAQSIPSSTWTTLNLALSGSGITNTIDNFGGWAATSANSYTIPVSGIYQVTGQVYFKGSTASTNWGAALIDNNGVRYQGDFFVSDSTGGATQESASVNRMLRLTAGQTIALQAWQSSGAGVSTNPVQTLSVGSVLLFPPRLICVFRTF